MTTKKKSTSKAPDKEKNPLEEKVDALVKVVNDLILSQKVDTDEEIDPIQAKMDAQIEKGEKAFRKLLKGKFPDEKLDAWGYDELLIAIEVKEDAIPDPKLNEIPESKEDTKNSIPLWLQTVVN